MYIHCFGYGLYKEKKKKVCMGDQLELYKEVWNPVLMKP